jgi:basic membrane lipoprotein Med (substrate-binding protein (PBP1-ABC) superfamily)/DNA-binding SARP family transcriptional activator
VEWLATHVTSNSDTLLFRVLGGLDAELGGRVLELGGGKQRAVLGALLLRAGTIVADARLIDEVWADNPPPSVLHGLEAYVSRLRHELAPHGVLLERRGGGYRLDLGAARLDATEFEALADEAFAAVATGSFEDAASRARTALDVWRGPVLAGVPLQLAGGESEHLDELRLRVIESYVDSSLALGRHRELVGEVRRLVDENPYREELVARLMVALYRSGRQAEALEAYETTRRLLMDELGIQPGPDLQRLSGQIVRHDPELARKTAPARPAESRRTPRRRAAGVAVFAVAVGLIAAVVGLTWDSGAAGESARTDTRPSRVALVLPRAPTAGREDTFVTPFVNGLMRAEREYGLETTTIVIDELAPTRARIDEVTQELTTRDFDVVLWAGSGVTAWKVLPVASRQSGTRFVVVDASLHGTPLRDAANVTALRFADEGPGLLAGYLAGRVAAHRKPLDRGKPVVSVIGGFPIPQVKGLVDGFIRGARTARPGIAVRVAYSGTFFDQSVCERMANRQIDSGSTVVFAAAGTCGLGALAATGLRGVWGVGADADRSYLGPHILVSTVKRYDRAVELAVMWFLQDSLPAGDVVLGLDDDATGITGISPEVTPADRRSVARLVEALRKAEATRIPEARD